MNALVLSLVATTGGIGVHALVLRSLPPRWRLVSLPVLLVLALVAAVALAVPLGGPVSPVDGIVALVLTLSLGLAYALMLVGVLYDSPTLALVNEIERHGPAGMPVEAFDAFVARHPFLNSRLAALAAAGELRDADGELQLTGKAVHLLTLGDAYLRLRGRSSAVTG